MPKKYSWNHAVTECGSLRCWPPRKLYIWRSSKSQMHHHTSRRISSLAALSSLGESWAGLQKEAMRDGSQITKVTSECLRSSMGRKCSRSEGWLTTQPIPQVPPHTATLYFQGALPPLRKIPPSLNLNTSLSSTQHSHDKIPSERLHS